MHGPHIERSLFTFEWLENCARVAEGCGPKGVRGSITQR